MHPQRELNRLALRKAELQRTIALHRVQCVKAAVGVLEPLEWLDRAVVLWRRVSPWLTRWRDR